MYQELTKITKSIQDGDFFENKALLAACENVKKNDSALHLMGLVSDGGVHSHIEHIFGLLELAKRQGLKKVYVHCFLDGRDTPPASGKEYVEQLEAKMKEIGVGEVASVMGRYYAMDRDNRWDRVEKAYRAIAYGEGEKATSGPAGIQASYDKDTTDEFVLPTVVEKDGAALATVKENDSIIFFNFRPDRAREITRTFCDDKFESFDRGVRIKTTFVCFTEYDVTIENKLVAFGKEKITNTFGEFLAKNGLKQARIAETEKYAHVTFFFNGGVEEPNEGEDRILVKSSKVATYDLKPEMSAYEVCDKLVEAIESDKYDVIIINFANPDMVGHTGVEGAAIKAIEAVDECVGKTVEAIKKVDGQMFICADHGNAEQLIDYESGEPFTAHTTNPVPFILVNADPAYKLREGGCLADIAPTLIELMGMKQPGRDDRKEPFSEIVVKNCKGQNMNRDQIKFLAIITMTCNHIANIFLTPGTLLFEVMIDIGYFTAITMCYFLVEGYGYTHDKKKYGERLLLFGVISFIPFCLAFGMVQMNMLCTLFLCFLILKVMEMSTLKWEKWIVILILIFVSLYSDWALLAPVFTILFAKSKGSRIKTAISFGIGACLFAGFNYLSNLESMNTGSALIHALCSGIGPVVAGIIILFCYNGKKSNHAGKASKWFFYIYYPTHLLFLWAVHQLFML